MYLLDTNVVSELRRPRPHGAVLAWLGSVPEAELHLSAVTIGELQAGIENTREQDPTKAGALEAWLERLAASFNIMAMDARAFRCWARLMHRRPRHLMEDAMIAAIAEVNNLTIVTRNVKDFAPFGSRILNPFENAAR